jgi:hypothetical protein
VTEAISIAKRVRRWLEKKVLQKRKENSDKPLKAKRWTPKFSKNGWPKRKSCLKAPDRLAPKTPANKAQTSLFSKFNVDQGTNSKSFVQPIEHPALSLEIGVRGCDKYSTEIKKTGLFLPARSVRENLHCGFCGCQTSVFQRLLGDRSKKHKQLQIPKSNSPPARGFQ